MYRAGMMDVLRCIANAIISLLITVGYQPVMLPLTLLTTLPLRSCLITAHVAMRASFASW